MRLLHPLLEDIGSHIRQEINGQLTPLTEAGTRQIDLLHLNRTPLVQHRQKRQEMQYDLWTRREILRVLTQIELRLQRLEKRSQATQ
jgi:hypothetical protein